MRISNRQYALAITEMLISAFCVALVSLFGKSLTSYVNLSAVVFLRFALPLVVLTLIAIISGLKEYSLKGWHQHLLRAVFTVGSQYCFFYYLSHGSILNATLLFATSSLFSPLIETFVLKKKLTIKTSVCIFISFLGVVCIINPTSGIFNGLAFIGLASGFLNSCSQLTFHYCASKQSHTMVTINMFLFSSALALIPFLIFINPHQLSFIFGSHANNHLWILLIAFVVVSISNQSIRALAYQHVNKATSLAPFLYMSIVFAGIFDWAIYNKLPNNLTIIGGLLVIVGGIIMSIRKKAIIVQSEINALKE